MRSIVAFASLAACLLAFSAADARGDLLDLTIQKPDIMADWIQMDYAAQAGAFTLSGFAETFDRGGGLPTLYITNGGFNLSATIDNSGTLAAGGTVTVSGGIPALIPPVNPADPLLVANLTGFDYRYNGVGGNFAFLLQPTGGSLLGYWGSMPGLILFDDMGSTFLGSFTSDFSNFYSGVTDVAAGKGDVTVVPTPGAAVMFLQAVAVLAGCGLVSSRQLRRGRQ